MKPDNCPVQTYKSERQKEIGVLIYDYTSCPVFRHMMTIFLEEPMKRLFALFTVIASTAILFSCGGGGGSSDDDSAQLSGESLTITKSVGSAVQGAVSAAMGSIANTPAMKVSALKVESEKPRAVDYKNDKQTLTVSGTTASMTVSMKKYEADSDGHKLVLDGDVKVTISGADGLETLSQDGTINVNFDGKDHTIIQSYKTVTNHEKGTYVTTGTVTFDGTPSKYEDTNEAKDDNKELGPLMTMANGVIDTIGKNSMDVFNGQLASSATFSFENPTASGDSLTLNPKASTLTLTMPDKTVATFTCADITVTKTMTAGDLEKPTVTTYALVIKNGTVKAGNTNYSFTCSGTRTISRALSDPQEKTVEDYSVTINGKTFPMKNSF